MLGPLTLLVKLLTYSMVSMIPALRCTMHHGSACLEIMTTGALAITLDGMQRFSTLGIPRSGVCLRPFGHSALNMIISQWTSSIWTLTTRTQKHFTLILLTTFVKRVLLK